MCDKCYITYVTVPVWGIEWSNWQWFTQFKKNTNDLDMPPVLFKTLIYIESF